MPRLSQRRPPKPVDSHILEAPAQERNEMLQEAAEKLAEEALDAATGQVERDEAELLREKLAKAEKRLAAFEKHLTQGDYSDLPPDHPFTVTVQATPEAGGMLPAKVWVNGDLYSFDREVPKIVPKFVLEVLDRCRYRGWEKMAMPDGSLAVVLNQYHRFPFEARPVYTEV